jgi:hypothetical protein
MAFTFTASSVAGTSAAAGATSGGVTPWYRILERTNASSFILSGTFVATIQPEYSNAPDFDKSSDFVVDAASYQAPTLRALPVGVADYVRFRCSAYTSGSPKISMAKALNPGGAPFSIQEDAKKTPAPSSVGPNN